MEKIVDMYTKKCECGSLPIWMRDRCKASCTSDIRSFVYAAEMLEDDIYNMHTFLDMTKKGGMR